MYNGKITDKDVKTFHEKVKLTGAYNEINNLKNGVLFDKTKPNKCFPKFCTDKIEGNKNIRVMDNKILIYSDNDDLNDVYFHGNLDKVIFDANADIYSSNYEKLLLLHFFDFKTLFNLPNFEFNIKQSGTDGINMNITTDIYGDAIIPLKSTSGTFTIKSIATGQEVVIE